MGTEIVVTRLSVSSHACLQDNNYGKGLIQRIHGE